MRRLSVDELLERAASVANLAMLRTYAEPSPLQIAAINEYTPLLESELRSLPPSDSPFRDRIQAQLDIHRSILAPIRRLPVELLFEIFSWVQENEPLRSLQAGTAVSHVCFTWRTVARGHGLLWTKVVVETLDDFDKYCERFLPMATRVPLELRCDNRKIIRDLWDRIAPYESRWRRITLVGDLSMFPDLQVLYMENLERLVVDAYEAPLSPEFSVLDFIVAPGLRHIALTLDALQSERQLHVPVTQKLTSLEITTMSPFPITRTLPLLQACADTLQTLIITIRHPLDGPDGSYPTTASNTFVMRALKLLCLVDPACALLNHISAPLIQELALSNVPAYGSRSLMGFLMRDRAGEHLETLRVYRAEELDPSAWIPCLQRLDNLEDLYFDDLLSNKGFLEVMTLRADKPPLLPAMRNIAIWEVFRKHEELREAIGAMCASRCKVVIVDGHTEWEHICWIDENPSKWRKK
ncbi:hypothetical protein EV121DRAFT_207462 [Schizophyllum commune]